MIFFSTLLSPLDSDFLEVMDPVDIASIQMQCLPHIKNLLVWYNSASPPRITETEASGYISTKVTHYFQEG